jgi:phospholipid transport system substrate-binding protein
MTLCRSFVALVALALLLLALPAQAGAPTDQLRQNVDQVVKTLEDPALKGSEKATERRAAVSKIARQIFDIPETAKRALGPHWQARTPAEREEFVRLFGDLIESSYITKIDRYEGEQVRYAGDSIDGDQAVVRTKIAGKQGPEIPVDYRMHLRDGRWLVYDVVIEGVSLVANYRTQFNKIIQTSSYEELMQKLKSKALAPAEDSKGRSRS